MALVLWSLWDLSVPVFVVSHFIFDPQEIFFFSVCDSGIFFLFHQLIVSLPLADQALLSATLDVPSTCLCLLVCVGLSFFSTDAASDDHRRWAVCASVPRPPPVAPLCPEQGRALLLQPSLIWSTVNRNSSQLDMPFSGFTCSFSFSLTSVSLTILVRIILYLSWSHHFIQKELISSCHLEIFEF